MSTRSDSLTERELLHRLSVATQAAGIFVWEYDWQRGEFAWDQSRLAASAYNRHYGQELGSDLFRWVHPLDKGLGHQAIQAALAQGKSDVSFRYRLRLADDSIRYLQAHAHTSCDRDGRPERSVGVSWDITSEVQAAEELRRISDQERKLLEHLSVATHAVGLECFEYDYTEQRFTWLYGSAAESAHPGTLDEPHGARIMASILPEDAEAVRLATERALAAGEDSLSTRLRRYDAQGRVRHVQLYQRFVRDAAGRPLRSLGAARDITLEVEAAERFREQAEQLHDAQRRLERASLSIQEGHWELDLGNNRHWVSNSYYMLLGYEPGEIDLSTFDNVVRLFHPEDHQAGIEAHRRNQESGNWYTHETRMRLKDGSYRWFRVRAQTERSADGRPTRLSGSVQDIHKQKLAEDELRLARQRFERAIRGTQDGLWEWDLEAQTLWVSPRYEAILGYPSGALSVLASDPNSLVHPQDVAACRAAQREHFESNTPYDLEVRMRTREGEYRWIRMRGEADRDANGQPLRLAGSIQDVSEARAARDALIRATEAAQAANRSKSAFLANVSHEIRTPMNGILGMTSLLLDTRLDPVQREFADTIRASATSLLVVINDLLDFSKIEAGKLQVESIEMDLPASIAEVRSLLALSAQAKQLGLRMHVRPDVPRRVLGDPQRLRQCLINLVNNAIKFTAHGEVVVEVAAAGQREGATLIRFEVRDSGIGIAPEVLPTLFQPFVQADSSTTRHFGGTGLGLSIVRRLVELMGGQIGVTSELGEGSLFWFELPLRSVAQRTGNPDEPAPAGGPGRDRRAGWRTRYRGEVLLVEDNPVNQKVARSFLERLGCRVTLAVNGREALQLFAQRRFDLVLIDLQMPIMDGYAATAGMRELERDRPRTPIVALTASAMSGQRERCLQAGMDDLLAKPLQPERLQELLSRCGLACFEAELGEAAVAQLVSEPPPLATLDHASLSQVIGGDAGFARELAEAFAHTSDELLTRMRAHAARSDTEMLRREAHSLKGAAANIYARALQSLCAQLEQQAASLPQSELAAHLAALAAERERVLLAFEPLSAARVGRPGFNGP